MFKIFNLILTVVTYCVVGICLSNICIKHCGTPVDYYVAGLGTVLAVVDLVELFKKDTNK